MKSTTWTDGMESLNSDAQSVGIRTVFNAAVLVSALGYFVDIYDLLLFSIVRVPSLKSLGIEGQALLSTGVALINTQMIGMLVGGVLWGVLADKKGRLSVLFGSIFLYSAANIANGFVTSVSMYAVLRFLAGLGLAGELGAAVTLISEVMTKETRGYGTSVVAAVGVLGAVVGALIGDWFSWRVAYFVGGGMGLALLVLRVSMFESGMFEAAMKKHDCRRGDVRMLFSPLSRFWKYLRCILVGAPIWYVVGILYTFAPELARGLGVSGEVTAGRAVLFGYVGLSIGDFGAGFLSQALKSRKKVFTISILITLALSFVYLLGFARTPEALYALCLMIGIGAGYWAMFVTGAAENFGTNLRGTVTTTAPNFVRALVVPLTLAFNFLAAPVGIVHSAMILGSVTIGIALLSVWGMEETFGKNLDYIED